MAVTRLLFAVALVLTSIQVSIAAQLPEDRADAMYHSYQGGGMSIDGPSILVRKKIGSAVSVSANYYVDSVSSASVDVLATASPYKEERDEQSVGIDFLNEKTLLSVGYGQSNENDYNAKTYSIGVSQSFFGDLSTLSFSYSRGDDEVGQTGNPDFLEQASRANFKLGWSQIASKNWTFDVALETISDQGYLNNPYRSYRYLDASAANGYSYATEIYPSTRTSTAMAVRSRYYFPIDGAIYGEARVFSDTWGIEAQNYKLGYTQALYDNWLLDFHVRHYAQTKADFYQDLFDRKDQYNYMARDKEMSTYSDLTIGLKVRYLFKFAPGSIVNASSLNLAWDHIQFDYDDFRNVLVNDGAGQEPFYAFSANVVKAYISIWY